MNKFLPLFLFLQVALLHLSGCSLAPHTTADISKNPKAIHIETKSLEDIQGLYSDVQIKFDPNSSNSCLVWNLGNYITKIPNIDTGDKKEVSLKYYRSLVHSAPNVSVMVEFPNGRKYPAMLDTGFPVSMLLTSDVVLDNKFKIHPITGNTFQGICRIPEMNIGNIKIENAQVFYYEQQWQLRVLNIPIYSHPNIILGIEFIKAFDYVLFDNVSQKVTFSKDNIFTPDESESWQSFLFEIKPDSNKNDRIMVQIPVNGHKYELFFDTCGDKPGFSLNQNDWDTISQSLTFKNLHKSYYDSWQSGRLPCRKATVSKLSIGEKKLKNVDVLIEDEQDKLSMLSLGYFQDTTVVLDFVNNLLWIKK